MQSIVLLPPIVKHLIRRLLKDLLKEVMRLKGCEASKAWEYLERTMRHFAVVLKKLIALTR